MRKERNETGCSFRLIIPKNGSELPDSTTAPRSLGLSTYMGGILVEILFPYGVHFRTWFSFSVGLSKTGVWEEVGLERENVVAWFWFRETCLFPSSQDWVLSVSSRGSLDGGCSGDINFTSLLSGVAFSCLLSFVRQIVFSVRVGYRDLSYWDTLLLGILFQRLETIFWEDRDVMGNGISMSWGERERRVAHRQAHWFLFILMDGWGFWIST